MTTTRTRFSVRTRITVYGALFLSLAAFPSGAGTPAATTADSLERTALRDSLVRTEEKKQAQYDHSADTGVRAAFSVPAHRLFDADITAPSEAMAAVPLCVPVRFGLSSRFNRYLCYGSPAPVSQVFADGDLLYTSFGPFTGTDDVFTTEISAVSLLPANRCAYAPVAAATVPEGQFYWENGVFRENVLALRFTRPFSERLNLNVFSNYRHFDAMAFNHTGNDVYGFYRGLVSDSSSIVKNGCNPLTNEYSGGARLQWAGRGGSEAHLGAKYTDCVNDLALDRPLDLNGRLVWSRLNQYRTAFDFGSAGNRLGPVGLDFQARFDNDDLVRTEGQSRHDGSNRELSCAVRANVPFPGRVSAAMLYRVRQTARKTFDRGEPTALEQTPALSLGFRRDAGRLAATLSASGGYTLFRLDRAFGTAPALSAECSAEYGRQGARAYVTLSALPYDIPYDSSPGLSAPLLDRYLMTGGEASLRRGKAAIVLGCQSIRGVEKVTVLHAWPENTVPYAQPRLVFLAAPELGPWRGFSLSSRALIADARPVLKSQTLLSFTAHPAETKEHIDLRLGFDYWSVRDPVVFATLSDWNRPICNVSFELAAHIVSFRFFGKIDNLLNRKHAWVPGYWSPGITFRWGIGWFLQR
jgi:hypothetical protein